jgi:hypothetical protein
MPGSKTVTAGGWKVTMFSLPAACVAGRDKAPVPVATLTKNDKDCWNLVLGANEAKLVPWPEPEPQTMPGAPPPKPKTDGLPTTTGKVGVQPQKEVDPTVLDPKLVAEKPTIELLLAKSSAGILTVEFLCGTEWFRLSMSEPKLKAGK